jgi:hypothetical protein
MNRLAVAVCSLTVFFVGRRDACGVTPSGVVSTFEASGGAILDSTFGPPGENWIGGLNGLLPHSGSQFFESDNGNAAFNFDDERYAKQLGGVIENRPYDVSFYIAANKLAADIQAVLFSDFDSLAIGGAGGTMMWTATPAPTPGGGWVQWRGTYMPSAADMGTPFQFRMIVDIDARHSLALDGPMMAQYVPEPAAAVLAGLLGMTCAALRTISSRHPTIA